MAKKNGNSRFEKAQFYNAEFYEGNSRNQFRGNAINNLESASEQTKGQLDGITSDTVKAYTAMYGQLVELHSTKYLNIIDTREREHYRLLTSPNENGYIYRQYNEMYKALEKRHKTYLDNIAMPDINSLDNQGSQTSKTTNNAAQFATELTLLSIKETLEKIREDVKYSGGGFGGGIADPNSSSSILKGIDKNTENMTKEERERNRQNKEIASKVVGIYSSLSSSVVQGKTNSQLLHGITSTLSSWIQGGPWAALATAAMEIANAVTQFFGQAIGEHWQTMEESFSNYGVYVQRWNDQYAGYTRDILNKQDELYALELNDNIKSTDWLRKQVELASKGFDSDTANSAAIQDILLSKIAPHLDTSSNIFMDLQQRGLRDITQSLGGLVESVRNISGASRITQASLSTMVDQLGPVELYAKKNLLTGKAAASLAALEQAGLSTEDAVKIVSTVSGVVAHPGSTLTGGSTMERLLAVALSSGNVSLENAVPELIGQYLGYANTFTGNIPANQAYTAMLRDVVNSTVGIALSPYADTSDLYTAFNDYYELYKDTTEEPQSAYRELYTTFESGFFQTADQRLEILANNSELAAGANGFLHQIAEWTLGIYDEITRITDKLLGRSDADVDARKTYNAIMSDTSLTDVERTKKLQDYLGSHTGYSDEMAKKYIDAMYSSENAKFYDSYYLETLNKYDKAAYDEAVLSNVAYQTQLWKNLYGEAQGKSVIGTGDAYDLALATGSVKPESFKSNRAEVYNDTAGDEFFEIALATLLAPGIGTRIAIGENAKNWLGLSTGSKIRGMATGGYVDRPQLAIVGEGGDPELVTPVPQLVAAVSRGINSSSRMKADYSEIIATVNNVGTMIVQAIKESNSNQIVLDTSSGLLSGSAFDRLNRIDQSTATSLQPIMKRG